MPKLDDLTALTVGFRDESNWKQFHNPKDMAISLSLEAAELLEHFQWKNANEIAKHLDQPTTARTNGIYFLMIRLDPTITR